MAGLGFSHKWMLSCFLEGPEWAGASSRGRWSWKESEEVLGFSAVGD